MASQVISITVTDNGTNTLAKIRDTLNRRFGGVDGDSNGTKLAHIQGALSAWLKSQYRQQIIDEDDASFQQQTIDIQ